jgi:hypothetical protein
MLILRAVLVAAQADTPNAPLTNSKWTISSEQIKETIVTGNTINKTNRRASERVALNSSALDFEIRESCGNIAWETATTNKPSGS